MASELQPSQESDVGRLNASLGGPHILGFHLNTVRANRSPMETVSLKETFLYHGCT